MNINLKYIASNIFKQKDNTVFYRLIGLENKQEYNNELKLISVKCEEIQSQCILFDNDIPLSSEMELIKYIYNELNTMNIKDIVNQDIVIFDDNKINIKFLNALQYCIDLSLIKENFFNENIRNNFITKLIVWSYTYMKSVDFDNIINPKCIYYGKIERHEIYFLILTYLMGFDVLYINPLKEEYFDEIDIDNLSKCVKKMHIDSIETFKYRCNKGILKDNVETFTKKIQKDIHKEIFENTGIFKPWQFRGGFTKSVLLDTVLDDIYIYYNEPTKLREGFEVNDNTVKVPCFFYKIDGQYLDIKEYKKLVKYCIESSINTLFFNTGNISKDIILDGDLFKLTFCQLNDRTFDINEVKKLDMYKFHKYSDELQNFLLMKFNELICRRDLYVKNLENEDILKLLALILELNEDIVRLIDNFDFVLNVPKIVIYLNNEDIISNNMILLLGYLHNIGIDIIIFNPSSLCNINTVINSEMINSIRLQHINYKSIYKNLFINKGLGTKKSIFEKIFR